MPDGRALHLYGDLTGEPRWRETPEASHPSNLSHRRWHPLRHEWVVYSSHRQSRIYKPDQNACPLCADSPGGEVPVQDFSIAVFDNRFSALQEANTAAPPAPAADIVTAPAQGTCEVVVYSSDHAASMGSLPPERRELLIRVWASRIEALLKRGDVQAVMPFENRGEEAGVTLHHPHGQIYAFSYIPPVIESVRTGFREGFDLASLLGLDTYRVADTPTAAAFVPPFARFPYEVWLAPKTFRSAPGQLDDQEVADCATLLGAVAKGYDRFFGRPTPYIMVVYTAPKGAVGYFPFHIQFYPLLRTPTRLKFLAGCELGSGSYLVDVLPEVAAEASAPARANLIGEHTDYNAGLVLPAVLPFHTTVSVSGRAGAAGQVEIASLNFPGSIIRMVDEPSQDHWSDYVVGCLRALEDRGIPIPSLTMEVSSDIPMGAGISSSAALSVATLRAVRKWLSLSLGDEDIALLAHKAEHDFVGVPCGMMDQFVCALGKPGFAFLFDTQAMSYRDVPLPQGFEIMLVNCGKSHALAKGGGYAQRVAECQEACQLLGVPTLRELQIADLPHVERLPDPLFRRARHIVTENKRVIDSVAALERGDVAELGALMAASHVSQRDDFDVSIPEIDALVESSNRFGIRACRLTGGGFGGSVIAFVPHDQTVSWWRRIKADNPASILISTYAVPSELR